MASGRPIDTKSIKAVCYFSAICYVVGCVGGCGMVYVV